MRLLICAGGTGGGVYPALAVLQAMNDLDMKDVLWIGSDDGIERTLVERAGITFRGIPSAGIHGVNFLSLPGRLLKLAKGYFASKRILKEFDPDVMFFTGGYTAIPVAFAGKNRCSAEFIPDVEPGMALKVLYKTTDLVIAAVEETRQYVPPEKAFAVSGYPTRADLNAYTREQAREIFQIHGDRPVLFVFGGSKGALSVNRALAANLKELLSFCEVIHISGQANWGEAQAARNLLSTDEQAYYHAYAYLHEEMGAAFAAADLVICRAGASILGELPLFGVPAILVPYPYAWRYQKQNAAHLADSGAALVIEDGKLSDEMQTTVRELFMDRSKYEGMQTAMRALANPGAAAEIGRMLMSLANKGRSK